MANDIHLCTTLHTCTHPKTKKHNEQLTHIILQYFVCHVSLSLCGMELEQHNGGEGGTFRCNSLISPRAAALVQAHHPTLPGCHQVFWVSAGGQTSFILAGSQGRAPNQGIPPR